MTREKRGVEEERGALENEVLNSAGNCTALQARLVQCQCGFIKAPVTDPLPNMICNSLEV